MATSVRSSLREDSARVDATVVQVPSALFQGLSVAELEELFASGTKYGARRHQVPILCWRGAYPALFRPKRKLEARAPLPGGQRAYRVSRGSRRMLRTLRGAVRGGLARPDSRRHRIHAFAPDRDTPRHVSKPEARRELARLYSNDSFGSGGSDGATGVPERSPAARPRPRRGNG